MILHRQIYFLYFYFAVLSIGLLSPLPTRADQPNVVFIISDDQAWTDYSFMGHPHINTPNIDKLAKESLTFRRGYVPSSLCRPSLASMVTGLYPHQHKITSNDPPLPRSKIFLAQRQEMINYIDKVPTLPRLLAKKGYLSHQSGKWWEGNHCRCGFTHGMTHGDPKRGGRHGDVGLQIGRKGLKPIFDFVNLAQKEKKPFYLWYAPFMPHTPHTPPKDLLAKYQKKTESKFVARYWAMCEWFDQTCGLLLDHLEEKGLAKNTIVVYMCDNGWIQSVNSGGYAPRSKRSPYDGGLRTPIMIRWPGKVKPMFSDVPILSIDVAPTILKACDLKPTEQMPGIDLLDTEAVKKRDAIFGATFTHNAVDIHKPAANVEYRWGIEKNWKLILPNKKNKPGGKVELFNLVEDPLEKQDLSSKQPERVAKLRKLINKWWTAKIEE